MDENLEAHEDFVGMAQLDITTAASIVKTIRDCLMRFNLQLSDCRGQCYDGASVMAGSKSGVAALISKVYAPCPAMSKLPCNEMAFELNIITLLYNRTRLIHHQSNK